MSDFLPQHPLLIPIVVFGLVSTIWLLTLTILSFSRYASRDSAQGMRTLRAWVDGEEHEVSFAVPSVPGSSGPISRLIERAGLRYSPRAFASQTALLLGASFVVALVLSRNIVIALGAVAIISTAILLYLNRRGQLRRDLMARQMVQALRLASRSLRAGHPVSAMLRVLADRTPNPTGKLFAEIVQREALGEPLESAIRSVLNRANTPELRAFGIAILVQMSAGGNLAQAIDRLSVSLVDRIRIRERGRATTSHVRITAFILILVPIIFVTILSTYSYAYAKLMFSDPTGRLLLIGALLLLLAGILVVARTAGREHRLDEVPF